MASAISQDASDAMRRGPGPTDLEWQAAKGRITELYWQQGLTAKQVINIIQAERGLVATERMYKARFEKWGIATKNTKGIEYEAMRMIYDQTREREGIEVDFSAPRGRVRKLYHIKEVDKQLLRPGTREKRQANRQEIERVGLEKVLERKGVEVQYPRSGTAHPEPEIDNPGLNADNTSPTPSFSASMDSDSDDELYPGREMAVVIQGSLETASAMQSHPYFLAQPSHLIKEADLDMSAVFETMALNPPISEYYDGPWFDLDHIAFPQQSEAEAQRETRIWVYHVFETSIKTDENRRDTAAGDHRNRARNVFMRMLDHANPHILSSLIHISCVLSGLVAVDFYRSILGDCCELIAQNLSRTQSYATPYRYALACEDGDSGAISELGQRLLNGTEQSGYDSQRLSSNFLVCQQFRAHHLLENMRDAEGARDMLIRCLQESSRCLERNHSINVNGLHILARAYERLGQYQAAIDTYFDAAQRSQVVFGCRHPYRMMMLRNMALLQARLGINHEAEQNLRQVFWSRAELLGPGHGLTFTSEQELQGFLNRHGRHEESVRVGQAREQMYHDDKHWQILSAIDAALIRRQGRNTGLYWEKPQGLFKYNFVMPQEAYMRLGANIDLSISSGTL